MKRGEVIAAAVGPDTRPVVPAGRKVTRRPMTLLVMAGLLATMLVGTASADTPKVRWDPKDAGHHDIRRVSTETTPNQLVMWIGLWEPARPWGGGWILAVMDTRGTKSTDRYVAFQRRRCRVQEVKARGSTYIGRRRVLLRGERAIGCRLPLDWFDITKTVRFRVVHPSLTDEAPNKGYYVGI